LTTIAPARYGVLVLAKVRTAWAACVHEAGHAIVGVTLDYRLAFSDVSETLASMADGAPDEPSRTGFTRIFQIGAGHTPDIAFTVAGRAAEAVHGLIDSDGQPFDVERWRHSRWANDDDLRDAYAKALSLVQGSERNAWMLVEREYRRTTDMLGKRPFRASTLEIASMLMRDGRVQAETIHRIADRWNVAPGASS
jgi:hypothetical protein